MIKSFLKKGVLLILTFAFLQNTFGQAASSLLPVIAPPSPNATALGMYGTYPISYTNGTPNINIPLYEIKTNKLSVPISLSYHANGIKVDEFASNVGLGFTLNAGGAITRQINDLSDLGWNGFGSIVIPDESIVTSPIHPVYDEMANYEGQVTLSNQNKYDGQPDNFYFNYTDNSGKFILKNTVASNAPLVFTTIPYKPVKISLDATVGLGRFSIQDNTGTMYIFGYSIKDNSSAVETTVNQEPSGGQSNYTPQPTAWYLTEMISPDKTDTIFFKYAQTQSSGADYASNSFSVQRNYNSYSDLTFQTSTSDMSNTNINLQEIDYKSGKVVFEYGSRLDFIANRLNRIRIYQLQNHQYTELKRINFNQSYFTSSINPSQITGPVLNKRLRLDSIGEEGINLSTGTSVFNPPYAFDYYTNSGLIACLGDYSQDLWGYWNGATLSKAPINLILPPSGVLETQFAPLGPPPQANRVPDSIHLLAGTLKSIRYPTGGQTEFQFEPNQTIYSIGVSDTTYSNYHISTLGVYGIGYTDITFTATNTITANFQFSVQSNCTTCTTNTPEAFLIDLSNNSVLIGTNPNITTLPFNFQQKVNLVQGHQYHLYFPSPGNYPATQQFYYYLNASLNNAGITNIQNTIDSSRVLTGGLRIKKVINRDQNSNVLTTKMYNYLNPYYITRDFFFGDFNNIASKYQFPETSVEGTQSNYTFGENVTIPLAGTSNGSLAYQEVEEYENDNNGNSLGKTVYDFNQVTDDNGDISSPKIDNSWRRNQLIEKRVYKVASGAYILLKDTKNTYADLFTAVGDTIKSYNIHPQYINPVISNGGENPAFGGLINGGFYSGNIYYVADNFQKISRNALISTADIDYDLNGANPVTDQVNYFYNNGNDMMLSRTETIKSNQDKKTQRTIYTTDYNLDQCNPGANYANLLAQLAVLKSNFYAQGLPIYSQWQTYTSRYITIEQSCLGSGNPGCLTQNQEDLYDTQIQSLYNQYQTLKTNYNTAVTNATNNYNQNVSAYTNCNISQLSTAVDSVKALLLLQQNSQVLPVESNVTYTDHTSGIEYVASINKSSFKTQGNIPEMWKTFLGFLNGMVPYSSYIQQPNAYLWNNLNYDNYDSLYNLVGYNKNSGPEDAFIWGYNGEYPVAQVANAASKDIFYDSFEEGDGNSTAGIAKTGHYSYNGSTTPYTHTFSSIDPGSYILSYWLRSPTSGTWSLVSTTVSAGATYTIAGISGQIDDVRFYPAGAQMTTYTYDPLIGMTSSTDAKNETTHYEYDGFERLLNIKDKDGNIIKHTDYHYQGQ